MHVLKHENISDSSKDTIRVKCKGYLDRAEKLTNYVSGKKYKHPRNKKMSALLDSSLVNGLRDFYQKSWPSLCDLEIRCSDGESVPAYKLILVIHSEYFAALFRQQSDTSVIELPQFD